MTRPKVSHLVVAVAFAILTTAAITAATYAHAAAASTIELKVLLQNGIIAQDPQATETEWTDKDGLFHRVRTPRRPGDTPIALDARHEEIVIAFLETFPVK